MRYKHPRFDKWENYHPNKAHFVHNEYYISQKSEHFHMSSGHTSFENGRYVNCGVSNKAYHTSHAGIMMDSYYIGKSDNQ